MVVYKDDTVAERAAAWHDHGHENNRYTRWEDMMGLAFRMSELRARRDRSTKKTGHYC